MSDTKFYPYRTKVTVYPSSVNLDELFAVPRSTKGMKQMEEAIAKFCGVPYVENTDIVYRIQDTEDSPPYFVKFTGDTVVFATKIKEPKIGLITTDNRKVGQFPYREKWVSNASIEITRDFDGSHAVEQELAKASESVTDNHVVYFISYKDDSAPTLYLGFHDGVVLIGTRIH